MERLLHYYYTRVGGNGRNGVDELTSKTVWFTK